MKIANIIEEGRLGGPQIRMASIAASLKGKAETVIVMPKKNSLIFQEFCEKNKLLCIDGFSNFPINNNTTSDLTHTNAEGSRKIAEKLFELLKPRIQL